MAVRRFNVIVTPLTGVRVVERLPVGDERGYFERLYCSLELSSIVGDMRIVQINHSFTRRCGTIRGLHYQLPPHAELKLVSCIRGAVYDVAVDVRRGSPTFLQWHGEILSSDNHKTLAVPEGCAHGFQTLTEDCEMLYLHTAAYEPTAELGINAMDPRISVRWPAEVSERSVRDMSQSMLSAEFEGIAL